MKRCPNCGTDNSDDSFSCKFCGASLVDETGNNIKVPPQLDVMKPPPPPPGYGYNVPSTIIQSKSTLGLVSMILGIAAVVMNCGCYFIAWGLGIAALITGVMGRKNPTADKGMALAGIITGIIGIIISVVIIIIVISLIAEPTFFQRYMPSPTVR